MTVSVRIGPFQPRGAVSVCHKPCSPSHSVEVGPIFWLLCLLATSRGDGLQVTGGSTTSSYLDRLLHPMCRISHVHIVVWAQCQGHLKAHDVNSTEPSISRLFFGVFFSLSLARWNKNKPFKHFCTMLVASDWLSILCDKVEGVF